MRFSVTSMTTVVYLALASHARCAGAFHINTRTPAYYPSSAATTATTGAFSASLPRNINTRINSLRPNAPSEPGLPPTLMGRVDSLQGAKECCRRRGGTSRSKTALRMSWGEQNGGGGGGGMGLGIRALGTLPYLLPLLDGVENGENLFRVMPQLGTVVYTLLGPLVALWDNVTFLPLITFILLSIAAREQRTPR